MRKETLIYWRLQQCSATLCPASSKRLTATIPRQFREARSSPPARYYAECNTPKPSRKKNSHENSRIFLTDNFPRKHVPAHARFRLPHQLGWHLRAEEGIQHRRRGQRRGRGPPPSTPSLSVYLFLRTAVSEHGPDAEAVLLGVFQACAAPAGRAENERAEGMSGLRGPGESTVAG